MILKWFIRKYATPVVTTAGLFTEIPTILGYCHNKMFALTLEINASDALFKNKLKKMESIQAVSQVKNINKP